MRIALLTLSLSFLLISGSIAQHRTGTRDSSTTVIIFNGGQTESATTKRKRDDLNIIKLSPFAFIGGKVPLTYERSITDLLSVQVGVGLTTMNYVGTAWLGALSEEDTDGNLEKVKHSPLPAGASDMADKLYEFETRTSKPGYLLTVQPKVYFDQEGLEGFYMGVSYDHYRYNYQVPTYVKVGEDFSAVGPKTDEFEKINDLMVNFGWQNIYDRLTLEYGASIGKRNVKGSKYEAASEGGVLYSGMNEYTRSTLAFHLTFKVGFHF